MRVIMFQERFAPLVTSGAKVQTIRKRARCNPGDGLSLRKWTGKPYRSKQEKLVVTVCRSVWHVMITQFDAYVGGVKADEQALAVADGFKDFEEMREWFASTHGLPFEGELIEWV